MGKKKLKADEIWFTSVGWDESEVPDLEDITDQIRTCLDIFGLFYLTYLDSDSDVIWLVVTPKRLDQEEEDLLAHAVNDCRFEFEKDIIKKSELTEALTARDAENEAALEEEAAARTFTKEELKAIRNLFPPGQELKEAAGLIIQKIDRMIKEI